MSFQTDCKSQRKFSRDLFSIPAYIQVNNFLIKKIHKSARCSNDNVNTSRVKQQNTVSLSCCGVDDHGEYDFTEDINLLIFSL